MEADLLRVSDVSVPSDYSDSLFLKSQSLRSPVPHEYEIQRILFRISWAVLKSLPQSAHSHSPGRTERRITAACPFLHGFVLLRQDIFCMLHQITSYQHIQDSVLCYKEVPPKRTALRMVIIV